MRVAVVGGYWDDGSSAGFFYLNSNNDSTNSNTNIGSRLIVFTLRGRSINNLPKGTSPLGEKNFSERHGLVAKAKGREGKTRWLCLPKRVNDIFDEMCKIENIRRAIYDSARGKKKRKSVMEVLANADEYAHKIQRILLTESYVPSGYHEYELYDCRCGKTRKICSTAYYPDQIIFWCVINAIKPVIMRGMYEWCCGSIPGRGIKYGYRAVKRWLDCDWKSTKYCLKLDIHHFYQSISHEKLMKMFEHKIKDKQMLQLIKTIINSYQTGLPIGNYTSQWFANFYLEPLDHYIKQELHIKRYVRYVDDMVLFSHSKKQLHKACKAISNRLAEMGLALKGNYQIFPTKSRAVDFLGYQFRRGHVRLRKRDFLSFLRQYRKIRKLQSKGRPVSPHLAAGLLSRSGQLKHCNAYWIRRKIEKSIESLKGVVRDENKRKRKPACAVI